MTRPAALIINAGSSSLKFALFSIQGDGEVPIHSGHFQRIGQSAELPTHAAAVPQLLKQIAGADAEVAAVGHRIVHGGPHFSAPQLLDEHVVAELAALEALSPEHMSPALSLIDALRAAYPRVAHIACFDTAFHSDLPLEARTLPIPRRYAQQGVRRYGFHGLSYAYLMEELGRVAGPEAAGKVLLAHLGNGASMAAVRGGRCIDTTMALTPAAGLVMSTRSGDLDPGVGPYLARTCGVSPGQFEAMVHKESGLLGISETSGDVRDLLAREASDPRAAEALSIFCYQARKWIGALSAALGGLDTLVFSGGIGENAAQVRARICAGLEFLGLSIDDAANRAGLALISAASSRVAVRILHTNEEAYMKRLVLRTLRPHST